MAPKHKKMKLKRKSKHANAPGVTSGNVTAMFNRNLLNKIGINIYFTFQRLTSHVYYKKNLCHLFNMPPNDCFIQRAPFSSYEETA